jgi:Predicted pPIWI-associating nuclease
MFDRDLEEFIDRDLDNVVTLFNVFNEGTHGSAGTFTLGQLAAIKQRVEDAIRFLHSVIR